MIELAISGTDSTVCKPAGSTPVPSASRAKEIAKYNVVCANDHGAAYRSHVRLDESCRARSDTERR